MNANMPYVNVFCHVHGNLQYTDISPFQFRELTINPYLLIKSEKELINQRLRDMKCCQLEKITIEQIQTPQCQ